MNHETWDLTDREWEDLGLASFTDIEPDVLQFFEDHSIQTIGALLGATQGLSIPVRVGDQSQGSLDAFMSHLLGILPPSLLEEYRATQPEMPPPGILPDDADVDSYE